MKAPVIYLFLSVFLLSTACATDENEKKVEKVNEELQQFKAVELQSFTSNYGTVDILLPKCIKEGYTTELSLTDLNNRVCESKGIYFSIDAISSYKLVENYSFKYSQKDKTESDYPKNPAAYLVDYAIQKRIQVVADFISSEFQTYQTDQGNKLWVKSMYGHKNKFAEEQFYVFGGFIADDVCYILQFICLNKNSKYYFNDFITFFKSAELF